MRAELLEHARPAFFDCFPRARLPGSLAPEPRLTGDGLGSFSFIGWDKSVTTVPGSGHRKIVAPALAAFLLDVLSPCVPKFKAHTKHAAPSAGCVQFVPGQAFW